MDSVESPIKEILVQGKWLVDKYKEHSKVATSEESLRRLSVTYIGSGYHLVFTSNKAETPDEIVYRACIYDFTFSQEPMLIFSGDSYFPKASGFDAQYWLKMVNTAARQFVVAIGLVSILNMNLTRMKDRRLAPQDFKSTVDVRTDGMIISDIVEVTTEVSYLLRQHGVANFFEVITGCSVSVTEEELQPVVRVKFLASEETYSQDVVVVCKMNNFSVECEINEEVGKDLGKLHKLLKGLLDELNKGVPNGTAL